MPMAKRLMMTKANASMLPPLLVVYIIPHGNRGYTFSREILPVVV